MTVILNLQKFGQSILEIILQTYRRSIGGGGENKKVSKRTFNTSFIYIIFIYFKWTTDQRWKEIEIINRIIHLITTNYLNVVVINLFQFWIFYGCVGIRERTRRTIDAMHYTRHVISVSRGWFPFFFFCIFIFIVINENKKNWDENMLGI